MVGSQERPPWGGDVWPENQGEEENPEEGPEGSMIAEVWQEAETSKRDSVKKYRQSLMKPAREITITEGYQRWGGPGALLAAGQGEKGLPVDTEGPTEAMTLGKGIQPTPGDLARKKQEE